MPTFVARGELFSGDNATDMFLACLRRGVYQNERTMKSAIALML
ncbi:MAG TPA: hypothetical protein VN579_04665 [Bryobacteraceae bacterium]|nr:hypothetical protein [Bryobacteraceae bacterium]